MPRGNAGAPRAAIHFVDLPDVGHAPHAATPLDEVAVRFKRPFLGSVRRGLALIDLLVADLNLPVGSGRQDLAIEALRPLPTLLVGVLSDAFVEAGAEFGQRVGQSLDRFRTEGQEPRVRGPLDGPG